MLRKMLMILTLTAVCGGCSDKSDGDMNQVKAASEELPAPPAVVENDISGPLSVYEETVAVFSVERNDSADTKYLWSIEPPDAGVLGTPTFPEVGFHASDIQGDSDVEATLTVEITRGEAESETRSRTISIVNLDERRSWMVQWRAGGWEGKDDMCVDPAGSIYVTGQTVVSGDLDPGAGLCVPRESDLPFGTYVYISKFSPEGEYLWSRWWGGREGLMGSDVGLGIDTDSRGNAYVIGTFEGTCDFDPGSGIEEHESQLQYDRITSSHFVSSFDPDGNFRWARILDGMCVNNDASIYAGSDDSVLCTGVFSRSALEGYMAGGTPETIEGDDAFLVKMDAEGNILWYLAPFEGERGGRYASVKAVTADVTGVIFITGRFVSVLDLDPGEGVDMHGNPNAPLVCSGACVAAFNPDGDYLWGRAYIPVGEHGNASGSSICTDGENLYIAGSFSGRIADESDAIILESSTNAEGWGWQTACVMSVAASGQFRWAKGWGADFHNGANDICIDPCGFLYASGEYYAVRMQGVLENLYGNLARLSVDGELKWLGGYDEWSGFEGGAVDSDRDCNILVLGYSNYDNEICLAKFAHGEYE